MPGLKEAPVQSAQQALEVILSGNTRRTMASTRSNEFSSRSHAIVQIQLERVPDDKSKPALTSKLSIVDLAGSEKEQATVHRKQRQEGTNINQSLLALAQCIKSLTRGKGKKFVPYRDSKLTRLLKDSLGGNAKTVMICCVTTSFMYYDETLSTLKYATQARKIRNPAKRNVRELNDKSEARFKKVIRAL